MKIIFWFLSLGFSTISFAQLKLYDNKPSVYLDSAKIELEYFLFDHNKIEKFDVVKNHSATLTNNSDRIYITTKQPKNFNFLSYGEIKRKYFSDKIKPILLLLNGNFIKNFTKINIDSSYISKVEVETGNDYDELKNLYPFFTIVNIKLNNENHNNDYRYISLEGLPPKFLPK